MRLLCLISLGFVLAIFNGCNLNSSQDIHTSTINFDVRNIPFSYKGSGLALRYSHDKKAGIQGLTLTDITGNSDFGKGQIFSLELLTTAQDSLIKNTANPGKVSLLIDGKEYAESCFETESIFRLRGSELPMLLNLNKSLLATNRLTIAPISEDKYHIQIDFKFGMSRYILTCLQGALSYNDKDGFELTPSGSGFYEVAIEETDSSWQGEEDFKRFDACVSESLTDFNKWVAQMPAVPEKYARAKTLGAYILWSSILNEGGNIKRPGMLMSKNWMHYIWSWDHCFNAMSCSYHMPEMALDQFMIMFDHQGENGQLPDLIGRGRVIKDYLKPPIHGWSFKKLMANIDFTNSQLSHVYDVMEKWTNYWFIHMDSNKNGLPEYTHGNDSGWDNGSEFDVNGKAHQRGHWESANLYAYLILQMDVLEELAIRLDKPEEAKLWKQKSDNLLSLMIANHWDGNRFITKNIDTDDINKNSQSLMAYLPIVLGKKLPSEIRIKLIDQLKHDGYLTQWGLATENPNSEMYDDDGYWKGPIWAPSTLIIVDGLKQCGEHELASHVAEKFCDLCLLHGFAENYNALTGEGLRDKSYTWTASVFFILAHDYLQSIDFNQR